MSLRQTCGPCIPAGPDNEGRIMSPDQPTDRDAFDSVEPRFGAGLAATHFGLFEPTVP